ncbi:MAG: MscL family protein [Candidatus Saccharimonadales bacterium]
MADEKQQEQEVVVVDKQGKRHKGVTMLFETDDVVREQVGGFSRFLQDYAVVGLALGFIVGQQANGVVKQFVASFLDPLVEFLFGQDLSDRVAIVHHHQQAVKIPWGAFVYTLLEFFFVLIAMYAVIKIFKLDRFAGKKKKKK